MSAVLGLLKARHGLKFKAMAMVVGLILIFGFVVIGNFCHGIRMSSREDLIRRGVTIGHVLSLPVEGGILTEDAFGLHQLLRKTLRNYDDVEYIFVEDKNGGIISDTFPEGFPVGLAKANPFKANGPNRRMIRTQVGLIHDIAFPLLEGGLGSVHVGMKESVLFSRIFRIMLRSSLITGITMILGGVIAFWLTGKLSRRLASLILIAHEVGAGNLDARCQDQGRDELGALAKALNTMAADLKRSQEQILRSGKFAAIGQLASSVAHEINNPLNTMGVCAQALRKRAQDPELAGCNGFADFPEYLDTIHSEIFRCKGITSALLDFARPKERRRSLTNLRDLIRKSVILVRPRAKVIEAEIVLDFASEELFAVVDADQILQVFLNVIINAIDHLPRKGTIRIRAASQGHSSEVSIQDTGCGIAAEIQSRVFDAFFTTKPGGKGTGLGLAVCHEIVERHGGKIEISSLPGKGTTVTLTLPAANEIAAPNPRGFTHAG